MEQALKVEWIDRGREPKCPPNPEYPNGVDLDLSGGLEGCKIDLPYPAKRCGVYVVSCAICGLSWGCTTAGRPDDPRSIKVPCRKVDGHA